MKNQNNLYLGKTGLQVYVKNKNSNISQLKTKDDIHGSFSFFSVQKCSFTFLNERRLFLHCDLTWKCCVPRVPLGTSGTSH